MGQCGTRSETTKSELPAPNSRANTAVKLSGGHTVQELKTKPTEVNSRNGRRDAARIEAEWNTCLGAFDFPKQMSHHPKEEVGGTGVFCGPVAIGLESESKAAGPTSLRSIKLCWIMDTLLRPSWKGVPPVTLPIKVFGGRVVSCRVTTLLKTTRNSQPLRFIPAFSSPLRCSPNILYYAMLLPHR